ncbi:MAG: hypothetical protein KKE96_00535, partial [Candidatus Altiarchaeota archaeon]|nr:hypothetical protein [Candidatus Altiarchaeota archaeon]
THWEFYGNVTGLDEAVYQYQGWANDTAGNDGTTGVRTLTIDTFSPVLNFSGQTPVNNSYLSVNYTEINISIEELHLDEFRFSWNSTNYTFLADAGNSTAMTIGDDNSLVLAMSFNNMSAVGENYNNSAGMLIYDYSGLGNNGTTATTAASPTYNASGGRFGGAFEFDGVDDYVEVVVSD